MNLNPSRSVYWIVVFSLALLIAGCARRCGSEQDEDTVSLKHAPDTVSSDAGLPPDDPWPAAIVLVVVDTVRADFLPFYGHSPNTTPFLEKLLSKAVIFENAYSTSSWTVPAMASLHTGVYPSSHGVVTGSFRIVKGHRELFSQPVLPDSFTTLAETLRGGGYKTIGVVANQHLSAELGFAQGFDHYSKNPRFANARLMNRSVERHLSEAYGQNWSQVWLQTKTFLFLHYFDPHDPYTPRIPWSRVFAPDYLARPDDYPANMSIKRIKQKFAPNADYKAKAAPLYESEIAFWDDQFNRFAEKAGLDAEDVLVIFTSDHGEQFGEHGSMGHGNDLHEEVVHIPLVISWPRGIKKTVRVSEPVSLVDLFPTIAELAGIKVPAGLAGRSLAPALTDQSLDATRPVFMELHSPRPSMKAWYSDGLKLIRKEDPDVRHGHRDALYDLSSDPLEKSDLSRVRPADVIRLSDQLEAFVRVLPPSPAVKLHMIQDEELLKQLINMDYVKDDALLPAER